MKKRILLAEDDRILLKMTKVFLERGGFEVVAATDGKEALRHVEANGTLDLIVLDIKMPKLDGLQVCQQLKANPATAKIPIIVFSGSPSHLQNLVDQCIELGITDWLKKPFQPEELLEKVRHALGKEGTAHG